MKKNRIIVLTDESRLSWDSLGLLEQQAEIYLAKGIQDTLSHLTIFSYHLILIAVKREPEIVCQLVEAIRKLVITPMIVLLPDHFEMRNKIIQAGADVVLTQLCTDEISLQVLLESDKKTLQILLLKMWGFSVHEIAGQMGLPEKTIYTRIDRLKKKIKKVLKK